ncbi:MAG: c-type cytochrome biogenesis protein CcsB [Syntrophales bacterium]|nr:c-type cytochrome biogenesis protein CcsB [Syntrophales bacterium]MDY0043678.1 c-type cytochrome biogenesis protein CcsB [Syntrophales bacterium]
MIEMNDTFLVSISTFFYFFGALVFFAAFVFQKRSMQNAAILFVVGGFSIETAAIIIRWAFSYQMGFGHAPLSNLYESLVFFSWSVVVILFATWKRHRNDIIGTLASFFAFILLAYASLSGNVTTQIQPLIPALQSNWLISHVVSSFLAYACFAISFITSILYLIRVRAGRRIERILPDYDVFDDLGYRITSIGFVLLSLGIITGAVWADTAWGRYWGWDPKETWSLITWMIYGAYIHARLARGWKGTSMALISIIGFIAVIFTYLGVNYILSGLHSYM